MAEKGKHPVAMRPGGTPVPIPNTKVKPREADDTAGTRESRWPPELEKRIKTMTARETFRVEGGLAQLGEHLPCKQGVESSNLLVSTAAFYAAAVP